MDTTSLNLDVQPEIVARIVAAADQLFQDSGRAAMPNVDTVRRKAHVNMNDASRVMRAWRKAQAATTSPLPDAIPERVQEVNLALLQAVWTEASNLATRSLLAAQTSWESERVEAEGFRSQLAAAFDEQSNDLQSLQTAHGDAMRQLVELQQKTKLDGEIQNRLVLRADAAEVETKSARRRCTDLERHIDDMRSALSQVHGQIEILQCEKTRQAEGSMREISRLREDIQGYIGLFSRLKEENASLQGQLTLALQQGLQKRERSDGTALPQSPPASAKLKSTQSKRRSTKDGMNGPES